MREDFAGVDDDVIAFAVAEGTGDTEAEVGSLEGEGQFGELSATLGVEFALAGSLRLFPCGLRRDRLLSNRLLLGRLLWDRAGARR